MINHLMLCILPSIVIVAVSSGDADNTVIAEHCDTMQFSGRKYSLSDLRFVYHREGELLVELSSKQSRLLESVCGGDGKDLFSKYGSKGKLPLSVQRRVFRQLPESAGDRFAVLLFPGRASMQGRLTGLSLWPAGDGGYKGFLGVLSTPHDVGPLGCIYMRPCGVAFPCAPVLKVTDGSSGDVRDASERRLLLEQARGKWGDKSIELLHIEKVDVSQAQVRGYVGSFVDESRVVRLFVVYRNGEECAVLEFPEGEYTDEGFLLLEDPRRDYDLTPGDSNVYILPDLDGNGHVEIFVQSTISQVFSIEDDPCGRAHIDLVRFSYCGP